MAISYIGRTEYEARSGALPTHTTGDLILAFVLNLAGGNLTNAANAGWTLIRAGSGNANGTGSIFYKVAASAAETHADFDVDTTFVEYRVYRGTDTVTPIGVSSFAALTNRSDLLYDDLTLSQTDGTSWVARLGISKTNPLDLTTSTIAGYTIRSTSSPTGGNLQSIDTNGGTASGVGGTVNTPTAGQGSLSVELLASAAPATPVGDTLRFVVEPANSVIGEAMVTMSVEVIDLALDERDTTLTTSILLTVSGGSFAGTFTVAAIAGIATFPGIVGNALGETLTFTASATGFTSDVSSAFDIVLPPPSGATIITGGGMYTDAVIGGATGISIELEATSLVDGSPVTNLAFNTAGLVIAAWRGANGAVDPITLVTQTSTGAWASAGFAHKTNGKYRLDVPNSLLAAGVPFTRFEASGVAGVKFSGARVDIAGSNPRDAAASIDGIGSAVTTSVVTELAVLGVPLTSAQATALVASVFRAMHYVGGFGVARNADDSQMIVTVPGESVTTVSLATDLSRPTVTGAGAGAP